MKSGDFAGAIALFDQAIAAAPDDKSLYSNRSLANLKTRKFAAAVSDAQQCINLDPSWVKGYIRLGNAYRLSGQLDKAIKAYQDGSKVDPNNSTCSQAASVCQQALDSRAKQSHSHSPDVPPGMDFSSMKPMFQMLKSQIPNIPELKDEAQNPEFLKKVDDLIDNPNNFMKYFSMYLFLDMLVILK